MSVASGDKTRELSDLQTVQFVASALFDVSAEKIGRLRAAFEKNELFYNDISVLYESIKRTATERGDMPSVQVTAARKVYVAFTSNVRFYGSANSDVMRAFLAAIVEHEEDEAMVIGRTGKSFMENSETMRKVTYLSFAGDEPTKEELRQFLSRVEGYDEVHVFYPSFVNVFTQRVLSIDITHTAATGARGDEATEQIDYIFEPELPRIIQFFETRVRYLLFQRVALESELARTAARLFAMNRAQDRAEEEITTVRRAIRKDTDSFNDSRLLESFAAIAKWKS